MFVLICDDDKDLAAKLEAELASVFEGATVKPLVDGLARVVEVLEARRELARKKPEEIKYDLELDEADIVVVDYDLIDAGGEGFLTGETFAYLARCYSNAGYIIALNQFDRELAFDLTLRDHPESFADLNISASDFANCGLWSADWSKARYRPWSWPVIPKSAEQMTQRVQDVVGHLDERIWTFFGFPDQLDSFMPRESQAFVASGKTALRDITIRDFVMSSGQGLRGGKERTTENNLTRIAAARLSTWFESLILPAQDLLVDFPHLVERGPSLIGSTEINDLDKTATVERPGAVDYGALASAEFAKPHWLSRPAWWWTTIQSEEQIPEVKAPWDAKLPVARFLEDTSRFANEDARRQFVSALTSGFARRYVSNPGIENVTYRPAVRLASS